MRSTCRSSSTATMHNHDSVPSPSRGGSGWGWFSLVALAAATLMGCTQMPTDPDASRRLVLAEQGYFFVGGRYTKTKDGEIRAGQMYVQYQIPENRTQPYPIVMWHGGGQTGTNFMGTPDGRKGWGDYFLQRWYAVYIVDQPEIGRASCRERV